MVRARGRKPVKTAEIQRTCSECARGEWVNTFENRDWQGKPFCLVCPESQYHILRSQKACAKLVEGTPKMPVENCFIPPVEKAD